MADSSVGYTAGSGTNVDTLTNGSGEHVQKVSNYHSTSGITTDADILPPKFVAISAGSSGNNTLLAAVTSKKIRVVSLFLFASGTVNAKFQSGAGGTDLTGLAYLFNGSAFVLPFNPVGWFETASNTLLNLNLSAAVTCGGCLTYIEV